MTITFAFCLAWGGAICTAGLCAFGGWLAKVRPKTKPTIRLTRLNPDVVKRL